MTAKQRRAAYKVALDFLVETTYYFQMGLSENYELSFNTLCYALTAVTDMDVTMHDCPELYECKPKRLLDSGLWWPINEEGLVNRMMALEYAIEQTKNR